MDASIKGFIIEIFVYLIWVVLAISFCFSLFIPFQKLLHEFNIDLNKQQKRKILWFIGLIILNSSVFYYAVSLFHSPAFMQFLSNLLG
jgi:hypothetical protein